MGKPITLTIPHELGRDEARRRLDAGFADVSRHLGGGMGALSKHWEGDRLRFSLQAVGQEISGVVDVAESQVRLEVMLPGLLAMIAGKVKGKLQREGQLLLEKK